MEFITVVKLNADVLICQHLRPGSCAAILQGESLIAIGQIVEKQPVRPNIYQIRLPNELGSRRGSWIERIVNEVATCGPIRTFSRFSREIDTCTAALARIIH